MAARAAKSSSSLPDTVALLAGLGRVIAIFAAIAGALALVRPSTWGNTESLTLGAMMLIGGAAGWVLWSAFNAGRAWAWWVVLLGAAAKGVYFSLLAAGYSLWAVPFPVPSGVATAVCAGVTLLMLMPKTRRHFFATIT